MRILFRCLQQCGALCAVELYPIPAKNKHQLLAAMSKGEFDLLVVMIKAVQARFHPPKSRRGIKYWPKTCTV